MTNVYKKSEIVYEDALKELIDEFKDKEDPAHIIKEFNNGIMCCIDNDIDFHISFRTQNKLVDIATLLLIDYSGKVETKSDSDMHKIVLLINNTTEVTLDYIGE